MINEGGPRLRHGFASVILLVASVIHLVAATGMVGATQLRSLYGTPIEDPDVLLLLRHRAVLFAIVAALLLWALVREHLRTLALSIALTSTASFPLLAGAAHSDELATVRNIDLVLAPLVLLALVATIGDQRSTQ